MTNEEKSRAIAAALHKEDPYCEIPLYSTPDLGTAENFARLTHALLVKGYHTVQFAKNTNGVDYDCNVTLQDGSINIESASDIYNAQLNAAYQAFCGVRPSLT